MPISITKGELTKEKINELINNAFEKNALQIEELTEGFFNVAYRIKLDDKSVVLKIAPSKDIDIMTHEKNIMFSEVEAMKKTAENTSVPVPNILFYDNNYTILDREYFIMEMLEGESLVSIIGKMSEAQKNEIYYDVGKYTKMLNQIEGDKFGYYCQTDKQGDNWYNVFKSMILDTYFDAERKSIAIPIEKDKILELLEKDKMNFEAVKTPKFVHWDIWDGNIFILEDKIEGIIDFERCLWADELMEVGFRTYGYNKAFFDGYGIEKLTESEERRAKWYDIYLFLIACLECDYRMYDNRGAYEWGSDMLINWVNELNNVSKIEMENACQAITSMIDRSEKSREKFSVGTSQYTLQKNRINALKIAYSLIISELEGNVKSITFKKDELEKAVAPIKSLISKSEKAIGKLSQDTWQYKMLDQNIKALYITLPLLTKAISELEEV